MYSWSDNKEIMMCEKTDKVIVELFVSRLTKYQDVSENKMKGSVNHQDNQRFCLFQKNTT